MIRFTLILTALVVAQEAPILNWQSLLGSVQNDPRMQARTQSLDALQQSSGKALWKNVEVQYDLDGLDLREHKVSLQWSPLAWGERDAMGQEWKARVQIQQAQKDLLISKNLAARYRLGLQWIYAQKQKAYHQAMWQISKDREQVHLALAQTERFVPEALIDAQMNSTDLQGSLLGDEADLQSLQIAIRQQIGSWSVVQLNEDLLAVSTLAKRLDSLSQDSLMQPEQVLAQNRVDLVQARITRNQIQSSAWVDQWNLGWHHNVPKAGKSGDALASEIGLGVALRIPFGDNQSTEILRSQTDLLDAQAELQKTSLAQQSEKKELLLQIQVLLAQKNVLDSFAQKVDAGALFQDFAARSGADPLLLLRAKESSLQTQWRSEKLRVDIYFLYLRYLDLAGILVRDPGKFQF